MTTPDEMPVTGLTATQAHELVAAGRGVLVDTRDARLFDNAPAAGAISQPHATIEANQGRRPASAPPPDRTLILYCAVGRQRACRRTPLSGLDRGEWQREG